MVTTHLHVSDSLPNETGRNTVERKPQTNSHSLLDAGGPTRFGGTLLSFILLGCVGPGPGPGPFEQIYLN